MTFPTYYSFSVNVTTGVITTGLSGPVVGPVLAWAQAVASPNSAVCFEVNALGGYSIIGSFGSIPLSLDQFYMIRVTTSTGAFGAVTHYATNDALYSAAAPVYAGADFPYNFSFAQSAASWIVYTAQALVIAPALANFTPIYHVPGCSTDGTPLLNAQLYLSLAEPATSSSQNIFMADSPLYGATAIVQGQVTIPFVEGVLPLTVYDQYLGFLTDSPFWNTANATVFSSTALYPGGPVVTTYQTNGSSHFLVYRMTGTVISDNAALNPFNISVNVLPLDPTIPGSFTVIVAQGSKILRFVYCPINTATTLPFLILSTAGQIICLASTAFESTSFTYDA